jgi:hypothetical protein
MSRHTAFLPVALLLLQACGRSDPPANRPAGNAADTMTETLKAGAKVIQGNAPPAQMDVHLIGFHPMKQHPEHQMEAHHYCRQVNEDFAQCALFDGSTKDANLNGIEYIISEKLFETLPAGERQFWHPHNYEILSGQLVGPGLPDIAEKELMRKKMNSYGKTWHVWATDRGDKLPLGEPMLAWSFNRDGEDRPGLIAERDRKLGIDTGEERRSRQDLVQLARPQSGVDALKDRFGRTTRPVAGVSERPAR